jgi:hypothetical protein
MNTASPWRAAASRLPAYFCAAALMGFAASLWLHPSPPALGDFGDWTYEAVLLRDLLLGHAHAGYWLKHYPVPNSFNTVVMALLGLAMPWKVAAKLYLCLQLSIGFVAGIALFAAARSRHSAGRSTLWFVVPGAVFLGVNFWYGFMNFQVGVAWAMLICALLLLGLESVVPYALLLTLAFFTHMIPCAFACLAVLLYARQYRRWRIVWSLLPVALLSLGYIVGRFFFARNADAMANIPTQVRYLSGGFFAFKVNTFLKSFGFVNPSTNADSSVALRIFGDKFFLALFLLNALLAAIFLYLILRRVVSCFRTICPERFLWQTILVFAILYAVAPGKGLGVSDPGARLLQTALWVALFLAADSAWLMRVAAICGVCLLAANFVLFNSLATAPPQPGAEQTRLPSFIAHFGHMPYEDKAQYYDDLEQNRFDEDIFPTGLFLKR